MLLQGLLTAHAKELAEMKAYYSDISNANLDAIKALKEEAAEARRQRAAAEKAAADTSAENRRLVEPLAQVHILLRCTLTFLEHFQAG